jgi:hypothetical protein
VIINVYAPCNIVAKRQLWVELLVARNTYVAEVCVSWVTLTRFVVVMKGGGRLGEVIENCQGDEGGPKVIQSPY